MWCIPQVDGECVARMEDVLAPDLKRPVVCFDESPTQIGEVRLPIPADPCRARPDRATSDNIGLQIGPGGSISISATTRSRSVTGTVSPAASRTILLSVLRPMSPPARCGSNGWSVALLMSGRVPRDTKSTVLLDTDRSRKLRAFWLSLANHHPGERFRGGEREPLAGLGITSKTRGSAQVM
jgi:hypothetical protein